MLRFFGSVTTSLYRDSVGKWELLLHHCRPKYKLLSVSKLFWVAYLLCNCPEGMLRTGICHVLCVCVMHVWCAYIYFFFPQGPKEPPIGVLGERKE